MAGDRIWVMMVIVTMMVMTLVFVSGDPVPFRINPVNRVRHNHHNKTVTRRRPNRFGSRITRDLQHQGASQKQLGDRITRDIAHQEASQKQLGDRITRDLTHQGASQKQPGRDDENPERRLRRDISHEAGHAHQTPYRAGNQNNLDTRTTRYTEYQARSDQSIMMGGDKLDTRAKGDPPISGYHLSSAEANIPADTRTTWLEKSKGDTGPKLLNKLIRMNLKDHFKSGKFNVLLCEEARFHNYNINLSISQAK